MNWNKYIHNKEEEANTQSFTVYWPWNLLLKFIRHMEKKTTDWVDYKDPTVNCSIWKKWMEGEFWVINTSWKHIYHRECLISHCRDYLSKCQYPRNCPSRGCKKILGPQQITEHLTPQEYIKFEAFSLQRSGQKSRKQLLWCSEWHQIYAVGYDEIIGHCKSWDHKPLKFQDILKHLDVNAKIEDTEREKADQIYQVFIKDCQGIVERWRYCLKRRNKIIGYKYETCICEKVSKTIKSKQSQGLIPENFGKI